MSLRNRLGAMTPTGAITEGAGQIVRASGQAMETNALHAAALQDAMWQGDPTAAANAFAEAERQKSNRRVKLGIIAGVTVLGVGAGTAGVLFGLPVLAEHIVNNEAGHVAGAIDRAIHDWAALTPQQQASFYNRYILTNITVPNVLTVQTTSGIAETVMNTSKHIGPAPNPFANKKYIGETSMSCSPQIPRGAMHLRAVVRNGHVELQDTVTMLPKPVSITHLVSSFFAKAPTSSEKAGNETGTSPVPSTSSSNGTAAGSAKTPAKVMSYECNAPVPYDDTDNQSTTQKSWYDIASRGDDVTTVHALQAYASSQWPTKFLPQQESVLVQNASKALHLQLVTGAVVSRLVDNIALHTPGLHLHQYQVRGIQRIEGQITKHVTTKFVDYQGKPVDATSLPQVEGFPIPESIADLGAATNIAPNELRIDHEADQYNTAITGRAAQQLAHMENTSNSN